MTTTSAALLPIGAPVVLLPDTFGEHAATGRIAGYCTYAHPVEPTRPQQGYAIHLDRGFFGGPDEVPQGNRPWIGTIVAHADSVEVRRDLACEHCGAEVEYVDQPGQNFAGFRHVEHGFIYCADDQRPTTPVVAR